MKRLILYWNIRFHLIFGDIKIYLRNKWNELTYWIEEKMGWYD